MARKHLIAVAILIVITAAWAPPAGAAQPSPIDAIASASNGARRAVVYQRGVRLQYRRLTTAGAPTGTSLNLFEGYSWGGGFDRALNPHAVADPAGTMVSYTRTAIGVSGYPAINEPVATYVNAAGTSSTTRQILCTPENHDWYDGPPAAGDIAWNGSIYLFAGVCLSDDAPYPTHIFQLRSSTFDPATSTWSPVQIGPDLPANVANITLAASTTGFTAAWQTTGPTGDLDIAAQRFDTTGTTVGGFLPVATGTGDQMQPTLARSGQRVLAAWVDQGDIAGRYINPTNQGARKLFVGAAGDQNHPSLAAGSNTSWHLVWSDLRTGNNDIWSAHIPSSLTPTGAKVVAGGPSAQRAPTVSALPNGRGFTAYLDGDIAKVRDLTAASAPTGTAKKVAP